MTAWEWFWLLGSIAPIPAALLWRLWRIRQNRKLVEGIMAYRRERFRGVIREPGSAEVKTIEKDSE